MFFRTNTRVNKFKVKNISGLTFIELVITIAISSVVLITLVSSIRLVYQGNRFAFEQAESIRSARIGVEHMVRDVREAAYSDIGDYPILSFASSSIVFFSDIDRDASIERVRYFIENGNLKKGLLEPVGDPSVYDSNNEIVSTVSTHVRNLPLGRDMFTYYDIDGNQVSGFIDVTDVAFILVNLIININPLRAPDDLEIRSSASLRNINYAR